MIVIKLPTLRELTPLQEMQRDALELGDQKVRMMQSPDLWSQWPYLPLRNISREDPKKGPAGWVMGFLIDTKDKAKCTVYLGPYCMRSIDRKTERFDSFEAVVAAGWDVD